MTASTNGERSILQLKYMMTMFARMNVPVASLPSSDGLNVRGPIDRLTIATTPTMTTSRVMTRTVSQMGTWLVSSICGSVSTTKVVTSSSLSAIGSSHAPKLVGWLVSRAMSPSIASVAPATRKTASAAPRCPYTVRRTNAGISMILRIVI